MRTRLLLVESDAWDAGLIQEALDELEERPHENRLGRSVELFHAETLDEAIASVASENYDLILLDLSAGGTAALHPFLRLRDIAPAVPFVILTSREEEPLALTAMREGAAGYLLKEDIDCLPLARTLRAAFEHHQALLAREEMPGTDDLTGLTSRAGFLYLGETVRRLAARWGKPARLSVITLTGYGRMEDIFGAQARDMALIETGEMLRDLFPDADLLARTGAKQFAALSLSPASSQDPLQGRTVRWVEQRIGRQSDTPPLEYEACEWSLSDAADSLADLLCVPSRLAAMQE
ncbi:MAG: response regulator [Acidobacteria bacterium]|nr:response regulator [Acidobacteriota bacterium]